MGRIFNLLCKDSMNIKVRGNTFIIKPCSFVLIDKLLEGDKVYVYVRNNLYNIYSVDENYFGDLYLGDVTTQLYEPKYNDVKTLGTVVQGLPWIDIHNLTNFTLNLNGNICIKPNQVYTYLGRDHYGVAMGTIFKDLDGFYKNFQILQPITDIYYGVTSNKKEQEYQGFVLNRLNEPQDFYGYL